MASEPGPRHYSWEDYLYPPDESGVQVLRNKFGIRDLGDWHLVERQFTVLRGQEIIGRPDLVARTFDVDHWRGIHRQIFQDVYEWAGEFRTVDIAKPEFVVDESGELTKRLNPFAGWAELEGYADTLMSHIREVDMYAGRDRAGVVDGLADSLMWMNRLHPFREGNGRTQRVMAEHIAEHAGYILDWYRITPDEQNRIMALSYHDDLEPLHDALEGAVIAIPRGGSVDASPWPTEPTGPARAPNFWQFRKTGQQVLADATNAPPGPPAGTDRAAAPAPTPEPGYGR